MTQLEWLSSLGFYGTRPTASESPGLGHRPAPEWGDRSGAGRFRRESGRCLGKTTTILTVAQPHCHNRGNQIAEFCHLNPENSECRCDG